MENIMRKMLKVIALTGSIILVIAPSINANFAANTEASFLLTILHQINTAFSPTTAYLFAIGIISLVIFDMRGMRNSKNR